MNNHARASWRLHFKTVNLPIVVLTLFKPFSCYIVNKLSFKEKNWNSFCSKLAYQEVLRNARYWRGVFGKLFDLGHKTRYTIGLWALLYTFWFEDQSWHRILPNKFNHNSYMIVLSLLLIVVKFRTVFIHMHIQELLWPKSTCMPVYQNTDILVTRDFIKKMGG